MAIAFDADDVLVHFVPDFLKYYNQKHGTNYKQENMTSYRMYKIFKITQEEFFDEFMQFSQTKASDDLPVVEHAQEAVNKLKELDDLYVVTARNISLTEKTENIMDKYFKGCFKDIVHINNNFHHNIQKYEACQKLNAKIIIEDVAYHANGCARNGIQAYLFNKPWNVNKEIENTIQRVDSWKEITPEIFKSYNVL